MYQCVIISASSSLILLAATSWQLLKQIPDYQFVIIMHVICSHTTWIKHIQVLSELVLKC